jgi:tetratricopeptide (TPR) repeat protein
MARARVPAATPPAPAGPGPWIAVAGVLLLGALAYSGSLGGEFLFDDTPQIVNNPAIRDLRSFLHPWGGPILPNRYVAYLTFGLNYLVGGYDRVGWHATNLAIHLATSLLVWAFVILAFRSPRLRSSALAPAAGAIAFSAAALFVAHPLATQAVTYVVQRLASLATLFYLLATVLYLAWRLRTGDRGRVALYAGALAAALLAVRTKEVAFTLPLGLALVEWAFLEGGWRRFLPILPVVLLALLIPLTLLGPGGGASGAPAAAAATDVSLAPDPPVDRIDYLRTQAVVVSRYLGLLVVPVGQSVDHEVALRRSWLAPDVAAGTLLLAGLAALGGWLAWRSAPRGGRAPLDPSVRLVSLGIGWLFVTLSVESSLNPIRDLMMEHRMYLPCTVLFPAVATAAALLFRRVDPLHVARDTAVAGGIAGAVLGVVTWNRNLVWRDDVALWTDAAAKAPGLTRPLSNLGAALTGKRRFAEAATVMRKAADLAPEVVASHVQLGVVLFLAGRPAEAEVELRRAVALDPGDPDALFNLAAFLDRVGRTEEARPYLQRLVTVTKDPERRAWAEEELAR